MWYVLKYCTLFCNKVPQFDEYVKYFISARSAHDTAKKKSYP